MTRYELLDRIGVGGMAEIFRGKAVAAGGFEKPVAIKRILPHLSQDKRFVELLIAEAKVLSLLKHRNIVQIFDVGLGDDAQYFLVMEYVDGKDLGAIQRALETKRRRIPFDLALHIGAEICEALEHAHSAKAPDGKPMSLVHRDVSPSNVLLSRAGEIKLTDFGIAKRAESEQTGSGAVRGKFAYISPEQARNEHLDPRSDVFAVAVLVWELVTNQRLFSGLGDLEALRAVREANVRRPTEADPRLQPEIDQLLMTALAKDPRRRPTAGQFGEQLRSLRYSLEVTVGDPATELAKIIDSAEQVARESQQMVAQQLRPSNGPGSGGAFDSAEHTEHTVIRIRTADAFQQGGKQDISAARQVIDRFEEEETRLAQLTGDQMKMLRSRNPRDSSELSAPPSPAGRRRPPTDEPTMARSPLDSEELATSLPGPRVSKIPHQSFDGDEATRLVAPTSRRTPVPERIKPRAGTQPPPQPLPGMTRSHSPTSDPPQHASDPGTVHNRNPTAGPHGFPPPERQPQQMPPPQQMMPPPQQMPPHMMLPQQPPMMHHATPLPQQHSPHMMLPQQPPMMHHATPLPQQQHSPHMMLPQQPPMMQQPTPPPGGYPMWGGQPDRAMQQQQRPSAPDLYGSPRKAALQPWMLVVGALVMAGLAFAITRMFIGG